MLRNTYASKMHYIIIIIIIIINWNWECTRWQCYYNTQKENTK
jgi:hypothetical protein